MPLLFQSRACSLLGHEAGSRKVSKKKRAYYVVLATSPWAPGPAGTASAIESVGTAVARIPRCGPGPARGPGRATRIQVRRSTLSLSECQWRPWRPWPRANSNFKFTLQRAQCGHPSHARRPTTQGERPSRLRYRSGRCRACVPHTALAGQKKAQGRRRRRQCRGHAQR